MAWTEPRTWANELASAAKWNVELRDNQRALKDPPSDNYESNEISDYTTNSTTNVAVDSDFSFSLSTTGGDVLVCFTGSGVDSGAISGGFGVLVDGTTTYNGSSIFGTTVITTTHFTGFTRIITGLSAGVHTFALVWAVGNAASTITLYAGAGTAGYDVHGQFWARELT